LGRDPGAVEKFLRLMLDVGLLSRLLLPARLLLLLRRALRIPGSLVHKRTDNRIDLRLRSDRQGKEQNNWQRQLDLSHD
jgi:hypothetical protein